MNTKTNNEAIYCDSLFAEYIPKEVETFVDSKNIKTNIFRLQAYDSIICVYFCIKFIELILFSLKISL